MSLSRLTPALWILGVLTILTASVTSVNAQPAQEESKERLTFAVSPPRMEVTLTQAAATGAIQVINMSQQEIPLQVSASSWQLDETNQVQTVAPTDALTSALLISPSQFNLPVEGQQTVRFALQPKVALPAGEHRFILLVEPQPRATAKPDAVSLATVVRLGVVVYVYVGDVTRQGTLHGIEVDPLNPSTISFDVSSEGNAHVRLEGQYAIWRAQDYPGADQTQVLQSGEEETLPPGVLQVEALVDTPVLPASRRTLVQQLTAGLDPGDYVLDINGSLTGSPIDTGIPFTVEGQQVSSSSQGQAQ